jgi:hypothetical protein
LSHAVSDLKAVDNMKILYKIINGIEAPIIEKLILLSKMPINPVHDILVSLHITNLTSMVLIEVNGTIDNQTSTITSQVK